MLFSCHSKKSDEDIFHLYPTRSEENIRTEREIRKVIDSKVPNGREYVIVPWSENSKHKKQVEREMTPISIRL